MKRILFVDDEPNILSGLKRMLMNERHIWDMHFVQGGQEALTLLDDSGRFDAIVSDMRMPQMQGFELLKTVSERWPGMARIILSGHAEHESALRSAGVAHQFLSKPCDSKTLKHAVMRTCNMRDRLGSDHIADAVAALKTLPVLPESCIKMREEMNKEEPSMERVAEIVGEDIAMTTKLLQLVNSSYFSLPRKIESIAQAVGFLGLDTIKDLVISTAVFRAMDADKSVVNGEQLLQHGQYVSKLAASMAGHLDAPALDTAELRIAGFIHDAGQLALAKIEPDRYRELLSEADSGDALCAAETEVFGTHHAEVGAYLFSLWGLPELVVEATLRHHEPLDEMETSDMGGLVGLADTLVTAARKGEEFEALNERLLGNPFEEHWEQWYSEAQSELAGSNDE